MYTYKAKLIKNNAMPITIHGNILEEIGKAVVQIESLGYKLMYIKNEESNAKVVDPKAE